MVGRINTVHSCNRCKRRYQLLPRVRDRQVSGANLPAAIVADDQQWTNLRWPVLPVPEDTALEQGTETVSSTPIESVLAAVVSLEAEQGEKGVDFFCLQVAWW